ncbi:ABC-3 protein [Roseibium sp. TrichSKD4]|nr:ABC-3 protein [Roseibium sp. TrichSKD4]
MEKVADWIGAVFGGPFSFLVFTPVFPSVRIVDFEIV